MHKSAGLSLSLDASPSYWTVSPSVDIWKLFKMCLSKQRFTRCGLCGNTWLVIAFSLMHIALTCGPPFWVKDGFSNLSLLVSILVLALLWEIHIKHLPIGLHVLVYTLFQTENWQGVIHIFDPS